MFEIVNNKISITKGDTARALLFINEGSKLEPIQYDIQETDVFKMYLYPRLGSIENAIWVKELTYLQEDDSGMLIIDFTPSDTANVAVGVYAYQIKLSRGNLVDTVIGERQFAVINEDLYSND